MSVLARLSPAAALARRFVQATRGGIIPMAAAGVPVVALLAIAATELASLSTEKGHMQDVADAVALDAANQLSFSTQSSVLARAEANALQQLADMQPRTTLVVKAEVVERGSGVRVSVNGTRLSFFGNMLPPGGFKTAAVATALSMNTAPLCVVTMDPGQTLKVGKPAQVDAGECLVHSNGDVQVDGGAQLRAAAVQAGGKATGPGMDQALTGAKTLDDPFASSSIALPSGCYDRDKKFDKQFGTAPSWPAGRHCGHIDIEETTVRLSPGVHVFDGEVQLKKGTRLVGDDVLIVFEQGARFKIDDANVRLNLAGRKSAGKTASGFVFAGAPNRTDAVELWAGQIERLEGVVYLPKARLRIRDLGTTGVPQIAALTSMGARSKWTVIIAEALEIRDDANMVVNSDYLSSDVPVPVGVGDKMSRNTRLLR